MSQHLQNENRNLLSSEKQDINNNNITPPLNSNNSAIEEEQLEDGQIEESQVEESQLEDIDGNVLEEVRQNTIETPEGQESVLLKLGDIIQIFDPQNEILNNNVFLIEYIDPTKVKLINSDTFEKVILTISPDGKIGDGSIQSIKIISSNSLEGYAKQNDLLPGQWVNIYFGGEIPVIITGEIINLEEDMIEIRTTDKDTIFINFNYQGIPEDLPIETIEIRPPIVEKEEKVLTSDELVDMGEELGLEEVEEIEKQDEMVKRFVKPTEVRERIKRLIVDVNDIEFGEIMNVKEFVNIDKEKYRYNIQAQTNDLLEEMLSTIPNNKRTNNVLNNLHTMISRFIQLRQISSTFDENKNINGVIRKTADDRPLVEYLSDLKNDLYWIMMISTNIKKIYTDKLSINEVEGSKNVDYENILMRSDLLEIEQSFKNWRSNINIEGQNKYSNLYGSLNQQMTPFYPVDIINNNVFNSQNGIIIEGDIKSNINSIVNNLTELYSSVVSNSEIKARKFVLQRYNLGLDRLEAENLKGSKMIAHRVKLTKNDNIGINGMLTLPEPTVRFSQINLPGSDLLVKANLNLHFLNYWQLLRQKTNISKIVIDGLDNEIEYTDDNFVDDIKEYTLDLSQYERPEEITNLDIYKIFLRTIIPKIRVLFNLVKKYIKGRLSLVDVVNYLEPFLIYPIDLTYFQYKEINHFIYERINEYNRIYKELSMAFSSLRYSKKSDINNPFSVHVLMELTKSQNPSEVNLTKMVFDEYRIDDTNKNILSTSEVLKKIILEDYGNLYNTAVALTNLQLMYPNELKAVFDMDKDRLKGIMERDQLNDKCSTYIIAKKYYSKDKLEQDNNKIIFFDKEFDNTNYDILEERNDYKRAKNSLSIEDLTVFLTSDLEKKGMPTEEAEYMSETLVNQAKKVRNGQYALLVGIVEGSNHEPEDLTYYVREDDMWIQADSSKVNPSLFIKDDDILCNMEYSCIYNSSVKNDDKCESSSVSQDKILTNALKQIIDQFDKNYNITKDELQGKINKHLEYYSKIFDRLLDVRSKNFLKSNDFQYKLGLTVKEEISGIVISPYAKLRDLILGQNDIVKKYSDLIKFITLYSEAGDPSIPDINTGEMQNEWWYYCKKTGVKLVPTFKVYLAKQFIFGSEAYQSAIDYLVKTIGKPSENGDSWIDQNSGEIICYVDADTTEGYKDGFVDRSRDIMEREATDVIIEQQNARKENKDKRLNPEGNLVSNIVTTLSVNMGINIENQRNFIIKVVTDLMDDVSVIEKEPAYKKREEEASKKGKKIPSYTTIYGQTLMYLTLGTYLIAVQTSIPPVKTKKTFPGCVRGFNGFPFEGEGDDSGLNYLACVALKNRDPGTMPWNALPKNEEKIAGVTKAFINKYLLPNKEIEEKMKDKLEYLLTNPEEDIPEEYSLDKWTNFLPPLKRFHISHLENISEGFTDQLQQELNSGNPRQLEKLLVIQSKIIQYSLAIQEEIQKIVQKKDLLLRTAYQPFMDNACCNEEGENRVTAIQYFANESPHIEQYNQIVKSLNDFIRDVNILTKSAIFLSEVNTKRIFPEVSSEFTEETIYRAFISLCNFQSTVPLTPELATVCVDKPNYLRKGETIVEKITKLKRDGRNYTKEQFLRLFQIVSRNNIINISLSLNRPSCVEGLKDILEKIEVTDDENVATALTRKLEILIDSYDVPIEEDTKEMRTLKDYLAGSIGSMKKEIIEFIKSKGKISSINLKNITKFINNISVWNFDEERNKDIKISDDSLANSCQFMKNFISLISSVFPTMIMNKNIQNIEPPKYWGLSRIHQDNVKEMVKGFYGPLDKFYGNNIISNILREIKIKCVGIELLSKTTPVLTSIKIGEKEVYSVFDKRITMMLYEYYLWNVFINYIELTKNPASLIRMLVIPESDKDDLFSTDFLVEQQMRFTETEQEFIEGDISKLKSETARLLVAYLNIMMKSKNTIDISYDIIQDKVFRLKEAEKYTFTDRLRDMTEEERAVDTILKHHKLGSLYSIGLSKGIRSYDPDNFDHDKKVAEKVAEIQNRLRKNGLSGDENDINDAVNEMELERDIATDLAIDFNPTDDYDDGDPWGDEREDYGDYN
jgi:hypothetical protein